MIRHPSLAGRLAGAAFPVCLAAVLYLSLRPEPASMVFARYSTAVGLWEGRHDGASNFIAFFVLASLGFWAPAPARSRRGVAGLWARPRGRLALLLALVVAIEIGQMWIPNRVSDWRDVLMGWIGIFAAYVVRRPAVRRDFGREDS
jgi:hypothetical protein